MIGLEIIGLDRIGLDMIGLEMIGLEMIVNPIFIQRTVKCGENDSFFFCVFLTTSVIQQVSY